MQHDKDGEWREGFDVGRELGKASKCKGVAEEREREGRGGEDMRAAEGS